MRINNDELYKLIKEMKELRAILPNDTKPNLLQRHKLKVKYQILEQILADNGINEILNHTISTKNSLLVMEAIEEEDKKENERNTS